MSTQNKDMNVEKGIRYYPIALFASVMGLAGVTMSVKLVETMYGFGSIVSNILFILTIVMFLINASILAYRLIRHMEDVKADFNHPVKMNFYATISISLLLLAALFYEIDGILSLVTWATGALLQLALTLIILSKLIWSSSFQMPQFNPSWFIPIVGNIVVPLAGVYHVSPTINWLFFSIGVVFSIIYFTIFMNRIFFHPPLPLKLTPTFFILIAPPGIGLVSYVKLVGEVDIFAYILYGIAFYLGLLFVFQIKRFATIPFFISWWAYLFPSAAVTNATIYMYNATGEAFFRWIIPIQIVGLLVLTIYLLIKTIGLAEKGLLTIKEE